MTIARLIYLSYIATESEATSKTETVNFSFCQKSNCYSLQNKVHFYSVHIHPRVSTFNIFIKRHLLSVKLCQLRNSTSNEGKWIQQERWKFALFVLLNLLVFENSRNCSLIMFHQNYSQALESQPESIVISVLTFSCFNTVRPLCCFKFKITNCKACHYTLLTEMQCNVKRN